MQNDMWTLWKGFVADVKSSEERKETVETVSHACHLTILLGT